MLACAASSQSANSDTQRCSIRSSVAVMRILTASASLARSSNRRRAKNPRGRGSGSGSVCTRLTNAFSKKKENHLYAVALHTAYYNYCRPHMTLTKAAGGIKTTPAMAAGLTDRVWGVEDILNLLQGN